MTTTESLQSAVQEVAAAIEHKLQAVAGEQSKVTLKQVLKVAMEFVEQLKEVKGANQKTVVLKACQVFVDSTHLLRADEKASFTLLLSEDLFASTIDLVVDASKGDLNINKVVQIAQVVPKKEITSLLSVCLSCLCGNNNSDNNNNNNNAL